METEAEREGLVVSDSHQNDFTAVVRECLEDSARWFPEGIDKTLSLGNLSVCLAGEVGEVCNIVKKIHRGSLPSPYGPTPEAAEVRHDLAMEATDVLIYLMNLFGILGIDPLACYKIKQAFNEERFGGGKAQQHV